MANMNDYFQRQYSTDARANMMEMMESDGSSQQGMGVPQNLNDIVENNSNNIRRRSMPVHYASNQARMNDPAMRRISMMDYNTSSPTSLEGFQFDPQLPLDEMMRNTSFPETSTNPQLRRQTSTNALVNGPTFSGQGSPYTSMAMGGSTYASPIHANTNLDMEIANTFGPTSLSMAMDMTDPSLNNLMNGDANSMMFGTDQFGSPVLNSPMAPDFSSLQANPQQRPPPSVPTLRSQPSQDGKSPYPKSEAQSSATPDFRASRLGSQEQSTRHNSTQGSLSASNQGSSSNVPQVAQFRNDTSSTHQNNTATSQIIKVPWTAPEGGYPSTMGNARPHMESQYKNAYSSTGFDMLGVLMRVATRPNPEINIGSVDLSCAFVVCDAEQDDNPIVYCSDNFERLTGYNKHEILGRNCRFLQSPDGRVEPGIKRKYVDDDSVLYLKNMITTRKEAQISLINYRRGGQPFMNLLTMIPITWDGNSTKFFVGFQVDLVEQPSSVTNKNPDGTYKINYQRGLTMPRYIAPDQRSQLDLGQTITRDEVSNVLSTFGTQGDSEFAKRIWDKILLENTDDVVHVLSLKGLFLYLSPSSRKILEYEANELVGTALSSVCHPSDIVPVTRELKDTSSGVSVNVVFRIRRKHSGYMWFEGHGSLHTEQGKGRKCIILVGRERPVYTLSKSDIMESGGIGDNELWTKMSTSGMFLFVSSNVRQLLDRQPEELVGTSIQLLMRGDSKKEFGRILSIVRTGKKASVKHEMMNKRGQILQAFTTVYPGDAIEGQKPTFLVAQTRMLKFSRGSTQRQLLLAKVDATSHHSGSYALGTSQGTGNDTPASGVSASQFIATNESAATHAGKDGLKLGHQDAKLASDENVFDELKTTRSTSWQYELRQMEKRNRLLAEEVQSLLAAKKKRKRRKGAGQLKKDCANCHTRVTPEWRRGPSGNRDLCNSCGLRWAKQNGRVSPRTSSQHSASAQSDKGSKGSKTSASPRGHIIGKPDSQTSPKQVSADNHNAKVARMEVAASQGLSGGVPPKIDEGVEPE
ncbi:hypothetical protein EJ05DRAFT_473331 [Pseudovirgaria hyperparasitica]|uniref:White collar n=1 Tax=Pseudovirgaria hyperparasitica TaxID=470096 RepID=A0A6A6WFN0_9PEZI|nr:uncharacterized protein EJ05DRAFT_473331 [Pseudovirgaria hyperparasitica]KAF2760706.1 hypothetical protein EJ05DRAFT_473331 [Pseudovirgaria hyperparasitica]